MNQQGMTQEEAELFIKNQVRQNLFSLAVRFFAVLGIANTLDPGRRRRFSLQRHLINSKILLVTLLTVASSGAHGQLFENLDFESAQLPALPARQYEMCDASQALPYWTVYYGSDPHPVGSLLHNQYSNGGGRSVSILGPNWIDQDWGTVILEGNYTVFIQPDWSGFGGESASIAQTGLVPSGARSLVMKIRPFFDLDDWPFVVSLNGHNLSLSAIPDQTSEFLFVGADVSAYAGQTIELRFTATYDTNTAYPSLGVELDAIAFSNVSFFGPQLLYATNDGTVTITKYIGFRNDVTIPGTIEGLPVVRIGAGAFWGSTSPTSVTISEGVTTIGDHAFASCMNLTNVTIPNSVASIADFAFASCPSIVSVQIPKGVLHIGKDAFIDCTGLTTIAVDELNSNYSSASGVLLDKTQETLVAYPSGRTGSYVVPNGVTRVGDDAFIHCYFLSSVTLPDSVLDIGKNAFDSCTGLTRAVIPNSITHIASGAFMTCRSLSSFSIPERVTSIEDSTFHSCINLTSVTISDSVTNIGNNAFTYTALSSITIPERVAYLGEQSFVSCNNLAGIYFKGNAPSHGSILFSDPSNVTVYYLPGTAGWGSTFAGRPTSPWLLPNPALLGNTLSAQTNAFGFKISWATNVLVVVEASTNLPNPVWTPVATNRLSGGTSDFSDLQWRKYPARFYRLRAAWGGSTVSSR